MNVYGATVYVKFDASDSRLKQMMATDHPEYRKIPEELIQLRNELQKKYDFLFPMDFRYFYALEEFELMGILNLYEDSLELVLELEEKLKELDYKNMITAGFGTVCLPPDYQTKEPIRVLNEVVGHGVYSAFQYFKGKGRIKKQLPYHFYSYHHKYRSFNVVRKTLEKRIEPLKEELRSLQKEDVKTQRHTYYPNFKFKGK